MPGKLSDFNPAVKYGAALDVTVDLTDILDQNGNEVIELDGTASAANHIAVQNQATGTGPLVEARGDDTNVGLDLSSKGTGSVTLWTGAKGREILVAANVASSVNQLQVSPSATGNPVLIAATGDDTNVGLDIDGKGTGTVRLALTSTSGGTRWKRSVLASSGNTTMTSAMSGSIMLLDGGTTAYTLPAIGAGDVGMEFWFVVTTTATSQTITAGAADLLTGGVMCMSTAAGVENDAFSPDVTDDLIITMNGTTQGGIIGSTWHLIAISATRWYCDGTTIGSGTLVTPFS